MLTMMVTVFVLMLLGAFVTLNQGQFSLLASGQTTDALERTSQSVYEYCFSKLENDKNWGASAFASSRQDPETRNILTVTEIEGTRKISGESAVDDATFEVEIHNNITGGATNGEGVPAGSCRLDISVRRSGMASQHTIQLNTAPLFDSSAVASRGLAVQANKLTVASRDPRRNIIRSKGGLDAPDADRLDFQPAPNASERGVLWAGGDITLGGENLRTNSGARADAQQETKGRFIDNAQTHYQIHDLKRDEIKIAKTQRTMGDGVYVFGSSDIQYTNDLGEEVSDTVFTLERREKRLVDGVASVGDVKEIWYYGGALPNNWVGADEWVTTDGYSDNALAHRVDSLNFPLYEGDNLIRADLTQAKIQISANVDVRVVGDFGIQSDQASVTPSLEFVDYDGTADQEYDRGSISADGEILIEGYVTGSGKLLANGSVSLYPNAVDIMSDTQSDLSIYSGNNVRIAPPPNWSGQGNLNFTGLVYAKNNVDLVHREKLRVEGAIVASEGVMSLNAKEVELVYNPAYLDSLVKEMPNSQIQLERAVWIP